LKQTQKRENVLVKSFCFVFYFRKPLALTNTTHGESLDATAFIPTGVQLEEFFSKQKTKKNRLLHQLIATHHLLFLSCLVFVGESAENRRKKKQFQSSSRTPTTCLYTFFLLYILRSA
jgi:hypothetical protein